MQLHMQLISKQLEYILSIEVHIATHIVGIYSSENCLLYSYETIRSYCQPIFHIFLCMPISYLEGTYYKDHSCTMSCIGRRKIKVFGKTNGLKSNIIREEIKREMCELIRTIMITILPSHSFIRNFGFCFVSKKRYFGIKKVT